ncbi:MAG: F0F1 ATP synthase subunit delta [Muribaculum sp.]|nr:F0F1 ATP synthase subunit delta [Muribaculaceae bacterium]MCM1080475.1 F0F1 ATP synthase subunit delta [Muribaculum sp.]
MDQGLIPRRYAKALYKFALEQGTDKRVYQLMKQLATAMQQENQLCHVMANPYVSAQDKAGLLETAAGADKNDKTFADFIALLLKNRRIEFARQIAYAYLDIYRNENNIYLVDITTAVELDADQSEKLHNVVQQQLGEATAEYSHHVDPELIGGFVININSERLDASVSNELKQLRLKLLRG